MSNNKAVLKTESSSQVIFDFKPKDIHAATAKSAESFIAFETTHSSDFKIDPLAAEQAGIAKLQRQALNERIEEEALTQIKAVQERAYREAYDLGLNEGRETAFNESASAIAMRLEKLDQDLKTIEDLKAKLVKDHEAHIVNMIFGLAKKIAMRDIEAKPDSIMAVLLQVIADTQSEERVTVHVSHDDFKFIETIREKSGKTAELLKRVKLEAADGIISGGCNLVSNYGTIDATIEMRLERAWQTLIDRLPKTEDRSSSDGSGDGA